MIDDKSVFTIEAAPNWQEEPAAQGMRSFRPTGAQRKLLQLSINRNPTSRPLQQSINKLGIAAELALDRGATIVSGVEGRCPIGTWGRVVFEAKGLAHGEAWVVTDGIHIMLATYTSESPSDQRELDDVSRMIQSVRWER